MNIPLGEVVYFDVVTSSPTTGAATDADSTPTFEVFEENTDTDIGVGGNLTKRTSKTGNYRGSFTASSANGFEAGKWYSVICSATVSSTAGKVRALLFRAVTAENNAGTPVADATHAAGTAWNSGAIQTGTFAAGAINAAAIAADAIGSAEIADGALTAVKFSNSDFMTAGTRLLTAIELDGSVYRFTTNALEQSPTSSGGDATAANQAEIKRMIASLQR